MDAIVESVIFYRYLGEIYWKELFLAMLPSSFKERFVNLGFWQIFEEFVKHLRGIVQVHEFPGFESFQGTRYRKIVKSKKEIEIYHYLVCMVYISVLKDGHGL